MNIPVKFKKEMIFEDCTVTKRSDGRFSCRVTIAYEVDGVTGKITKYHYKYIYGVDKQDALMKRGEFIQEQVRLTTETETTCDLMVTKMWEWLLNEKFNKVKPNTYDRLESTLVFQILPAMAECGVRDIRLKDVTAFHLNQIMGTAFEKGYSYSTLMKMRDFLRCIFNYYEDDIKRNPMRKYTFYTRENVIAKQKSLETEKAAAEAKIAQQRAELAQDGTSKIFITEDEARLARLSLKSQTSANDIHVFSEEEISKIKEAVINGYRKPFKSRSGNEVMSGLYIPKQGKFFLFMLNSGIRGGEAVALRYSDFDYENCTVRIHGTAVNVKERNKDGSATGKRNRVISSTKTTTSDALLDISPYAVSLIQELQAEEPDGYDSFILHSGDKPIAEKTLWQRFDKILRGAGVPQCGLHSLRHTYATMLYEATGGDIKLVSQQVRHSDPSFTTRTYVHQRNERTKNIIQKIVF